jgi:hypothetical protein
MGCPLRDALSFAIRFLFPAPLEPAAGLIFSFETQGHGGTMRYTKSRCATALKS